jgi:glycosyltransferase involved in cell wall biosynthesis
MNGTLSIIMPVLDEAAGIEAALTALAPYRDRGAEVIVVDGGSRDGTRTLARHLADCVLAAERGRAAQMNAGRAVARGGLLSLIAFMMNLRSRLTGIATGDQALFVTRAAFDSAGGFPSIALMEDVALSVRLKRVRRPVCIRTRVTTSGRRWREHGMLRTMFLMWQLRLAYFFGADPARLARRYGYASAEQ